MASGQSIIVGGGIQAGSPFALGQVAYVTNVDPPQLSGAVTLAIATDPGNALQYASVPNSAGTHSTVTNSTARFRVLGGAIIEGNNTDSVQIGEGAAATGVNTVAIGTSAVADVTQAIVIGASGNNGQQGVVVGHAAGFLSCSGVTVGNGAILNGSAGGASGIAIGAAATVTTNPAGGGTAIAIGTNATARTDDVVIGGQASSNQNSSLGVGNVVIGTSATANISGGSVFCVVIGWSAVSTQKLATVLGSGATATAASGQTRSIVIGSGASSTATDAIAIGGNCDLTTKSIALGADAVDLGAGFCQLGAAGTPITTVVIGAGSTIATPAAKVIRFTNASGADNQAGTLTIIAPRSTGSAIPATIIFQVGAVAGSSSTLQTATTVMTIGDQIVTFAGLISAAGLPTSAGAAGELWVDTGAGNVVKRA